MSKKNKGDDFEEMVSEEYPDGPGELKEQKTEETEDPGTETDPPEILLKEELLKEKDKFLRLFADFENYKKRTSRERIDLFKTAGQEVIQSLLPILDDFDRALKEISKAEHQEIHTGVALIHSKLKETLKAKGLQEIDVQAGDNFDADVHEAITQIPAPSKKLKGKIIDVVEKGFRLGDRIIRHPKVVVGH